MAMKGKLQEVTFTTVSCHSIDGNLFENKESFFMQDDLDNTLSR